MIGLSWQVTVLALVLLPIFVLPGPADGRADRRAAREAADLNAAMTTQMTERFSAPGATLVKLFGRPDAEAAIRDRAERVRDIGVRTAMYVAVFFTALSLVSALARRWSTASAATSPRGTSTPGTVVTLALLLTRLYAPLTALANARVDVMTRSSSFERVFEVLDLQPLITETPGRAAAARRPVAVAFDDVHFAYPAADGCRWRRWKRSRCSTAGRRQVLHGVDLRRAGPAAGAGRPVGRGQVDDRRAGPAPLRRDRGAVGSSGVDVRDLTFAALRDAVGVVTQDGHLFHDTIRANLRYARPDATRRRARATRCGAPGSATCRRAAGRPGDRRGRARVPAVGRRAAAADDRPAAAGPAAGGDPGRGHRAPRLRVRGRRAGGARRGAGGPHRDRDRAPTVDHPRPPTRSWWSRPAGWWSAAPTTSCSPPVGATPSCTGRSSPIPVRRVPVHRPRFTESGAVDGVACLVPGCDLVHLRPAGTEFAPRPGVDVAMANHRRTGRTR